MYQKQTLQRTGTAIAVVLALLISGCSSSGSSGPKAPAGPVASTLQTATDGWSFPNFPSSSYPEVNFDENDLVAMFGSGDKVCVGAVATPCVLTAEASAWARMVNQARASGHCEGLVALASSRFNGKETPATVKLPTQGETLHAIMRAFATQFIPEVQSEIQKWLASSLNDKVDALKSSIAGGKLEYTLGMYTEGGGHALLPYAIEYPEENKPRVMLYDSNWPGKNRYVDIDLKAKTWRFSFSGEDPENDPDAWTGGPQDMDLTPFGSRVGTCPFCGGDVKVAKTTMLIRSSNLDWSIESDGETVSPSNPGSGDGVTTRPVKGSFLSASNGSGLIKDSYDYVVEIPERTSSQSTTTVASSKKRESQLKFTGATSVYALMPSGIAQFTTPGTSDNPVIMQGNAISASDPGINMTLSSGNLVANASGSALSLSIEGNTMAVAVTTANGQVVQQEVSADKPTLQMKADPSSGGITVLAASSTGVVEKTEVSSSGQETKSVVTEKLELNAIAASLPPELASKESTLLPSLANRDMANPNYKVDVAYVAPTTVPPKDSNNQAAETATTVAPTRSTQGSKAETASNESKSTTTTLATKTTVGKSSGPTEVDSVKPTVGRFLIPAVTFGDASFEVKDPTTNSSAAWKFTSSKPDVASINATTGKVTIVGAGSTVVTAAQGAIKGFEAISVTATLVVNKDTPTIGAWAGVTKSFGDDPFVIKDPSSNSKGEITFDSSDDDVARINKSSGRVVLYGAGKTTITATQAATDDYVAATKTLVLTVKKGIPELGAFDNVSKTFGDADFVVAKPTSSSKAPMTFTSSDINIATINATSGSVVLVGAGTTTIMASQASNSDFVALAKTMTLEVKSAAPALGALSIDAKTYGDEEFTIAKPSSTSPGTVSFSSSDPAVIRVTTEGKATVVGAGSAVITAAQAASGGYSAKSVTATATVAKAAPKISNMSISNMTYGDAATTLVPRSTSPAAFRFSSNRASVVSVDAKTGEMLIVGAGTATITASQSSSANYEAASDSVTITIAKASGAIGAFAAISKGYGDTPFIITPPTSNNTKPFTFSSSNIAVATVDANTGSVIIVGIGSTTITASQVASDNHLATSSTTTLTVSKGLPVFGDFIVADKVFGSPQFTVTPPTSTSTGALTYTSSIPGVALIDSVTGQVTIVGVGTTVIRASQVATTNYVAASITTSLTVAPATPVFGSFTIARKYVGSSDFTVTPPTSTSTGIFSFTSSDVNVATINASTGVAHVVGAGTSTITATQAASLTHSAKSVSVVLTVQSDTALSGLSEATAGTSASQLKTVNGYTTAGNYWIKPDGYTGPARQVWIDFSQAGESWVLIGKGRQSNNRSGGWFGTDSELAVDGLLQENAYSAGISKLSAEFVNYLMNGTANGWTNGDANNYMVANRIANATDGFAGVGDSFKIKVTSSTRFTWISQFGAATGAPNGSGSITRYLNEWMTGATLGPSTTFSDNYWNSCNCTSRLFTWQWDGHGSYHGWSSGQSEFRGFQNTNEGHAIQFTQLWLRS